MFRELILKNRSYRRFYEDAPITMRQLEEFVDLARLSPFGGNRQTLKFYLSASEPSREVNEKIFETLSWAGYLDGWKGPEPGERPSGYIVVLNDTDLGDGGQINAGIAATGILLGAVEQGLGGCMFGSVDRKKLSESLGLAENLEIVIVIALGKPKEVIVIDEAVNGDIKYWRDENRVHHVPKRKLGDLIIN